MTVISARLAAASPAKPPAAPRFQRVPGGLGLWMDKAGADFTLAGRIEGLATCSDAYLARLAQADRGGYENLLRALGEMVARHVALVDGATELHGRIESALAAGGGA